jgi:hypothetical protein
MLFVKNYLCKYKYIRLVKNTLTVKASLIFVKLFLCHHKGIIFIHVRRVRARIRNYFPSVLYNYCPGIIIESLNLYIPET